MNYSDVILDTSRLCFEGDFDTQVQHLLEAVRMTRDEVQGLRRLFNDLERQLQHLVPGCDVMPFGSIVTGLGIKTSDVDCYVKLPNGMQPSKEIVMKAKRILHWNHRIFNELLAIVNCRVPIVKFSHRPTGISCDVSFQTAAGVRNSELIAYLLHTDKRALPLAVLLKYWSKVYKITGTNLMASYALTILVVFYLQVKNILPSVYDLQNNQSINMESRMVDNWETAFNEVCHQTDNSESLYDLLGGFFKYYSNLDFEQFIISPFTGQLLRRRDFQQHIPPVFHLYQHNLYNNICKELKIDTVLCIQDPFDHSRNCTVAVFPRLMAKILGHVRFAARKFDEVDHDRYLRAIFTEDTTVMQGPKAVKQKHVFKNKIIKNKYNGTHVNHGVSNNMKTLHKNKWSFRRE